MVKENYRSKERENRFTSFSRIIAVPRLIASLWRKYLNNRLPRIIPPSPPATSFAIFSFFYPLPVSEMEWSSKIDQWRRFKLWRRGYWHKLLKCWINQGTKFGTLKKWMFSNLMWFLIFFKGTETMSNIRNNRLPRIVAPFKSEKNNNNRPRLLIKEIR